MQLVLLFPGQGAQKVGMGRRLYENSACVRSYFDLADRLLPFRLTELCFNGPEEGLKETKVCQPALYVMGYSIFACLKEAQFFSRNELACTCGLSLGELTALAIAGVFDFETGLALVAERGRLMQEACESAPTGMLSLIGGNLSLVEELCQNFDLDVSNLNCPGQIVVSGPLAALSEAKVKAKAMGFKLAIPLEVAGAYHSRWMKGASEKFEKFIGQFKFNAPQCTVLTNVSGQAVCQPDEIKQMLVRQITSRVRWEDCMRYLLTKNLVHCFECGPGNVLAGLARRIDPALQVNSVGDWEQVEALLGA